MSQWNTAFDTVTDLLEEKVYYSRIESKIIIIIFIGGGG
jgi:hypothetical protein